ncbi:MAG TPA: hypothetical protein PKM65_11180 [Spirochaetota bacterium]|nr:hypothetical protein [Spirochaetota bacterium]HNT09360.1 hypothetical protein [Spirochaetota bacterium]HPU87155.1 hypothetical protein [Spirochaetota bacterium]
MTPVYCIAEDPAPLRDTLSRRGIDAIALPLCDIDFAGPRGAAPAVPGVAVVELCDRSRAALERIARTLPVGSRIVVASELTGSDRALLVRLGIPDAIADRENLAEHIVFLLEGPMTAEGAAIAIFDDNPAHLGVLSAIAERFGYRAAPASACEALCALIADATTECALVNLGVRGLDLGGLIRRVHADPSLRNTPIIAYKSLQEGVFIHEIAAGLKRLCRVILSPEELYGFLVETLFRMEIGRAVCAINREANPECITPYAALTLRQACRRFQGELFPGGALSSGEHAGSIMTQALALQQAVRRVRGLLWMVPEAKQRPICGLGAYI